MDDHPPSDDPHGDTGTPRWVKLLAAVAIVLLLLVLGIHLAGGGLGGHLPST